MSLTVTLNVFSGRPNPVWTLDDDQSAELMRLISQGGTPTNLKSSAGIVGLGYRGFQVTSSQTSSVGPMSLHVHDGVLDSGPTELNLISERKTIESFLLETGGNAINAAVREHVIGSLSNKPTLSVKDFTMAATAAAQCPVCHAADAPSYNPAIWNIPSVQPYNNCYNYANNQMTNTFAQPGRAHGIAITTMSCAGVQPGAVADGLVATPNFSAPLGQGQGWYVALVIWPGNDYHWYRQDNVGCWSHKPGQTAVRNVDSSGNPISDPQTCNRGPYTIFCTYMRTYKGVVIK